MKFFNLFKKEKLKKWINENAEGPQSTTLLSSVAFSEAIFFPVPPDVILIAIIAARRVPRWAFYASVTTLSSTFGAISGYMIGMFFFKAFGEAVISFYDLQSQFETISVMFREQTFFAVFVSALTPIPFKVFTLAGGLFKVNFLWFILASLLGRGIRYFFIAYMMKLYGHNLAHTIYKNFNLFSFITVIIIGLAVYLLV